MIYKKQGIISIHAPPRGATREAEQLCREENISIHAPPRGATGQSLNCTPSVLFQFTPLREGRRFPDGWGVPDHKISIHAPPRGATRGVLLRRRLFPYFNSRPSARGDPAVSRVVSLPFVFQFTPLREGRRRALP